MNKVIEREKNWRKNIIKLEIPKVKEELDNIITKAKKVANLVEKLEEMDECESYGALVDVAWILESAKQLMALQERVKDESEKICLIEYLEKSMSKPEQP